jgi:hypothetical protein
MLDVPEMAALLGISMQTIYMWAQARTTAPTSLQPLGSLSLRDSRSRLSVIPIRSQVSQRQKLRQMYTQPTTRCSMKRSPLPIETDPRTVRFEGISDEKGDSG